MTHRPRVLLIEDSPTQAAAVKEKLSEISDVTVAKTAAEAIRLMEESWDIVISDIHVPGNVEMSMIQILRSLLGPETTFIVFTGYEEFQKEPGVWKKSPHTLRRIYDTVLAKTSPAIG